MIKQHPYLPILCDSDTGMICHLGSSSWTFGSNHSSGYMTCMVRHRSYRVHRLIAETFLEQEEGKLEVDHIDRDKKNNSLSNLRWVSHQENCRNTKAYESVEARGWNHKGAGYSKCMYHSLKNSDEYVERNRENSLKWAQNHRETHNERSKAYYRKKVADGFKYVKGPDGKKHWVKEGSLSLTE